MPDMETEKEKLTFTLSEQFSQNKITLEEYEKMLDWVGKIETGKELMAVRNMVHYNYEPSPLTTTTPNAAPAVPPEYLNKKVVPTNAKHRKYDTIFSSRRINVKPENGKAGYFSCVFGTNQIKIDDLPLGTTELKIEAVFSSIEIRVPKYAKIINDVSPVFGTVNVSNESGLVKQLGNLLNSVLGGGSETYDDDDYEYESRPIIHIKGEAVFGSVSIKRV